MQYLLTVPSTQWHTWLIESFSVQCDREDSEINEEVMNGVLMPEVYCWCMHRETF